METSEEAAAMSVVLRCPSCGTTQATPGECEACHEAQVRYFCTNHEPGLWLDGTSCPSGARRGAGPLVQSQPHHLRLSSAGAGPRAASTPCNRYAPPRPKPRRPLPRPRHHPRRLRHHPRRLRHHPRLLLRPGTWGGRQLPWRMQQSKHVRGARHLGCLMLEGLLRARAARRAPDRPAAGMARSLPGCLLRLLVLAIVLFLRP